MRTTDFKAYYERAKKEKDLLNDHWLNFSAWFWMNLTELQHKKMYNLLLDRGAEETMLNGRRGIELPVSKLFLNKVEV